jgi:hypothetical protein
MQVGETGGDLLRLQARMGMAQCWSWWWVAQPGAVKYHHATWGALTGVNYCMHSQLMHRTADLTSCFLGRLCLRS